MLIVQITETGIKEELPSYMYLAKAIDLSPDHDPLVFWRAKSPDLLHWAVASKKVLVVQPSSAASERDFGRQKVDIQGLFPTVIINTAVNILE